MKLFGRELTTDEVIGFVRTQAPDIRKLPDCHDCLVLQAALALADALESEREERMEH